MGVEAALSRGTIRGQRWTERREPKDRSGISFAEIAAEVDERNHLRVQRQLPERSRSEGSRAGIGLPLRENRRADDLCHQASLTKGSQIEKGKRTTNKEEARDEADK